MVFAAAENGVIGKNGSIPWTLKDDMKLFREITTGHHVLMGRKTFESIGRPLPNRINLVVSRDPNYSRDGIHTFGSIDEAIIFAALSGETELMVIGGEAIYKEALSVADLVYLTRVHAEVEGDVKFDFEPDSNQWELLDGKKTHYAKDDRNEHPFTHAVYRRSNQ